MDPITHAVIGMAVAKAAGHDISLYDPVSVAAIIGAVFPDIDIVLQKWGDYVYLKNHRGVTHSILGLVISSMVITPIIGLAFPGANLLNIMIFAFIGCLSHSVIDIFNSYGAKLLWPVCNKKFSLSLLVIFDPIFITFLVSYVFTSGKVATYIINAFWIYLLARVFMRLYMYFDLKKRYGKIFDKISLLPSTTGLLRWHFILQGKERCIVGEKNILKKNVKIIQELHKRYDTNDKSILRTNIGRFFSEFTPIYHIDYEKENGISRYVFTDLRYYMKNNFLHHAVLEIDESQSIVKESFNPYSMKRSIEL